jgi:hypothetical protein
MAFVPERQGDRSLARSAWESPPLKNRPVGYGLILAGVRSLLRRLQYWNDEVSDVTTEETMCAGKASKISSDISRERAFRLGRPLGLAAPAHTVPTGRFRRGDTYQALRTWLRSSCPSGREYILRAEALIKLAPIGVNTPG